MKTNVSNQKIMMSNTIQTTFFIIETKTLHMLSAAGAAAVPVADVILLTVPNKRLFSKKNSIKNQSKI